MTSHRLETQYVLVRLGTEMKEVEIHNAGGRRGGGTAQNALSPRTSHSTWREIPG